VSRQYAFLRLGRHAIELTLQPLTGTVAIHLYVANAATLLEQVSMVSTKPHRSCSLADCQGGAQIVAEAICLLAG
jgi:hypothetical protein